MIIERAFLCFIPMLLVMFNLGTVQSHSDDSDTLLEIVHRQEQTLKTLMEGIQRLANTVEEMQTKIHGQEATINDLMLKTASQSSEIEELRNTVSDLQGQTSARSKTDDHHSVNKEGYIVKKRSIMTRQNPLASMSAPIATYEQEYQCAFYAYMNQDEHTLAPHYTLIFDVVRTNIANAYNKYTGVFTVPYDGLYVITWNIYSDMHSYAFSNLVVNQDIWNSAIANSANNNDRHASTGIVVVMLNKNDVVFVKTHETRPGSGNIESSSEARSTFSGWKIN